MLSRAAGLGDALGSLGQFQSLGSAVLSRLKAALDFTQGTRLLQLETPLESGSLLVERVRITEAVHAAEPLWAEIDCLSTSAFLAIKPLMGEQALIKLHRADGSWRHWHGHVVQAAQLGADGGLARYRLTLAAWTHWLQHRLDTRIFQDLHTQAVVEQVLRAWPQANFRFELAQPGPVRAITTQYRESDWAFVQRLMAQEGWSWRLEHAQGGAQAATGAAGAARQSQHVLVIFDGQAARPQLGTLAYSRPDIRRGARGLAQDAITAWRSGLQVGPTAVTVAAWDERRLSGVAAQAQAPLPQAVPALELYQGHGERQFADGSVATAQPASETLAQARADGHMAAHALLHHLAGGEGAVRAMAEGHEFAVSGHGSVPSGPEGQHVVLKVVHLAANNLGAEAAQLLQQPELEPGSYRNTFEAAPAALRLAPLPMPRPRAPGLQTAVVVAAEGQPLGTDRDQRIRVQFAWQRGEKPVAGALQAPQSPAGLPQGHAPGNEASGTWVRVAQDVAGPNWGTVFTPRAGTEVLVDFVDGDIDRPMVVGALYNGAHDLPWPAGEGSGANHPGTVAGWHSRHLDGQGSNQWLIDDATGQLRMRLLSQGPANGWNELSLGHLIAQSGQGGMGHAHRGPWLGEGFYGHTDGWAVVRAGEGLLLSTSARPAQGASVHSTQMDAQDAVAQLKAARQLADTLGQSAAQQGAHPLHSAQAGHAWQHHTEQIAPTAQGKHPEQVNGQPARKAQGRSLTDPVERFNEPLLHIDTPASAAWVSPSSVHFYSGQDHSHSTQGDLHLTAAHTLSSVSGQTTSLYTHSGGIKAITANAALSLRAHTDTQQVWSDQDLTVQSTTDEIRIQASNSITLTAGQSQIVIQGGDITFMCPGNWTVKGAGHEWGGGGAGGAALMALPDSRVKLFNRQAKLVNELTGEPMAGVPYKAVSPEGDVQYGSTDENGLTMLVGTVSSQNVEFHWGVTPTGKETI
ncbi:type VI secretion system tip protein VgrG [Aquabacterium lacunae]|uniref:Type VI secretion system tip protein VgrG n=1 Tax=Aquabacterium lacunae TaxID=2528630 RepID=A0A4Q9GYP1_9BURK|nr:type VI secretion system Vgr family protein [Aquabacterium lacunae]TBO31110.1 type VI secretion system tip protein VgrG [Aquabacterium lacunae]